MPLLVTAGRNVRADQVQSQIPEEVIVGLKNVKLLSKWIRGLEGQFSI